MTKCVWDNELLRLLQITGGSEEEDIRKVGREPEITNCVHVFIYTLTFACFFLLYPTIYVFLNTIDINIVLLLLAR